MELLRNMCCKGNYHDDKNNEGIFGGQIITKESQNNNLVVKHQRRAAAVWVSHSLMIFALLISYFVNN